MNQRGKEGKEAPRPEMYLKKGAGKYSLLTVDLKATPSDAIKCSKCRIDLNLLEEECVEVSITHFKGKNGQVQLDYYHENCFSSVS